MEKNKKILLADDIELFQACAPVFLVLVQPFATLSPR
jgi:hypothetical protein